MGVTAALDWVTVSRLDTVCRSLPSEEQMSSRFRVCTNLATAIKNLGYKDEISYNQFMYPNEKVRRAHRSCLCVHTL